MAAESAKPPTYDELLADNAKLKAYALWLEEAIRGLNAAVSVRDAEIGRLTLKAKAKPKRVLDSNAASAYDRPYDGR
jgi:hypothetical protein